MAVTTAYQSIVIDILGYNVCVLLSGCTISVCVFALLQMSLFIDGWLKQKQIHQPVKSHIISHHLAINHLCECSSARKYSCACNLISLQFTDLHNKCQWYLLIYQLYVHKWLDWKQTHKHL